MPPYSKSGGGGKCPHAPTHLTNSQTKHFISQYNTFIIPRNLDLIILLVKVTMKLKVYNIAMYSIYTWCMDIDIR